MRSPWSRRVLEPSEHDEQALYFDWVAVVSINGLPLRRYVFAVPNGGHRNPVVAAKLRAEGVTPGVPDVFVRVPSGQYHGMQLEAKRKGGKPSPAQLEQIDACREMGYYAVVAEGFDDMRQVTKQYLMQSWRVLDRWRG